MKLGDMKYLALTLLASLFICTGFSQNSIGVSGGVNSSNLLMYGPIKNVWNYPVFGFHFGLNSIIEINERLDFQPELQISRKGFDSHLSSYKFMYAALPLTLNYYLFKRLSVGGGVETSYMVTWRKTPDNGYNMGDNSFRKIDLGIVAGAQYLLTDKLSIAVNYTQGLRSVTPVVELTDQYGNLTGEKWKNFNMNAKMSLRYSFSQQKK